MNIKIVDLGVVEYSVAWEEQKKYFNGKLSAADTVNYLLYCEHPHVYTLGKSGHENNLLINDDFLKSIDASYFKIDRGGDITYHGYGQLVGYPIINISDFNLGLRDYIFKVEEAIIRTISHFGIDGYRVDGATGVWLMEGSQEKKICAIGVKASRYITMHGFALNVNTDLSYFNYINPCGFTTKGVTSISQACRTKGNDALNLMLKNGTITEECRSAIDENFMVDMNVVKAIYSKEFAFQLGAEIR